MLSKPHAQPKPRSPKQLKASQQRADAQRAKAFQEAVWLRDSARCQVCGALVLRPGAEPSRVWDVGHVHHIKPRSTHPELRFEVSNGLLLCQADHRAVHDKRITI